MSRLASLLIAVLIAVVTAGPAAGYDFAEPDRDGTVDVVDPGQGTLHELRYDWTEGDSRAVSFTIVRAESFALDGQLTSHYATSLFIVDTNVTVTEAFDDGTFEVVTEIVAVELVESPPLDAEASVLVASLETLNGLTIRERFDDLGNRSQVQISDPADEGTEPHPARDAVPSIMDHMVLQLPAEPIGVGGAWEVVDHITDDSGLELVGTSRHTLTAVEPDGTFLIQTSENADETIVPQEVDGSTFLPAAVLVLDVIEGRSDSVSRLDPTWPLAAYEGQWSMAMRMGLEAGGGSFELAVTSDTGLTIAPDDLPVPSAQR